MRRRITIFEGKKKCQTKCYENEPYFWCSIYITMYMALLFLDFKKILLNHFPLLKSPTELYFLVKIVSIPALKIPDKLRKTTFYQENILHTILPFQIQTNIVWLPSDISYHYVY